MDAVLLYDFLFNVFFATAFDAMIKYGVVELQVVQAFPYIPPPAIVVSSRCLMT